jgi:hypothetical protein
MLAASCQTTHYLAHGTVLAHACHRGMVCLEGTSSANASVGCANGHGLTSSPASVAANSSTTDSFAVRFCLPELRRGQNQDGGWGFRVGQRSALEPTSWALLAVCGVEPDRSLTRQKIAAVQFLRGAQIEDGSWPVVIGDKTGGWVTSLACLALGTAEGAIPEVAAGLEWLCGDWPGEGGVWWRLRHRLSRQSHLVTQDHRLRGWSWTHGTSSWVEPTAYALLATRQARGSASFLARVEDRCNLARKMLCNRMCPGGGWNCGNPSVYGAAGEPIIGPTCWALLALGESARHDDQLRCICESLAWLGRAYSHTDGAASLALAHLCRKAFNEGPFPIDSQLAGIFGKNRFLGQISTLAWVLLASQPAARWLSPMNFRKR